MIGKAIRTTGIQKRSVGGEIPERPHIDASASKLKVLYIAGWGRSGSTILGRILGQLESFFLVGELRYIWDRGFMENWLCSCGKPFHECPMWREVISRVVSDDFSAEEMVDLRERGLRTRHLLLMPARRVLDAKVSRTREYQGTLETLYRAVQSASHSKVLVDTSKFPAYGYTLQNIPGIELYTLQLVRDPRAVAYSWEAKKKLRLHRRDQPGVLMVPHNYVKSSLVWDEWNLATEHVRRRDPSRFMLLRYEDFVRDPRSSVQSIARFVGEEVTETDFEDERTISLGVPHTFSGNPDRFQSGPVTIKSDEAWKRHMSVARQMMVAALTWPGLLRYGYPIRPQRESSRG